MKFVKLVKYLEFLAKFTPLSAIMFYVYVAVCVKIASYLYKVTLYAYP